MSKSSEGEASEFSKSPEQPKKENRKKHGKPRKTQSTSELLNSSGSPRTIIFPSTRHIRRVEKPNPLKTDVKELLERMEQEERERKTPLTFRAEPSMCMTDMAFPTPARSEESDSGTMAATKEYFRKMLQVYEGKKEVPMDEGAVIAERKEATGDAKNIDISAKDAAKLQSIHGDAHYCVLYHGTKKLYVASGDSDLLEEVKNNLKTAWEKDEQPHSSN